MTLILPMIGSGYIPAGGGGGITFVGSITKEVFAGTNFNTPAESIDVLSVASVGDLVVLSLTAATNTNNATTFGGMPMATIRDDHLSSVPASFLGYRIVQAGDSNPYLSSNTGFYRFLRLGIIAAVFRGASGVVGASEVANNSSGMPDPPSATSNDSLRVIVGHLKASNVTMTAPAGFNLSGAAGTTSSAIAYQIDNFGTVNPAAFGGGGSADWRSEHVTFS